MPRRKVPNSLIPFGASEKEMAEIAEREAQVLAMIKSKSRHLSARDWLSLKLEELEKGHKPTASELCDIERNLAILEEPLPDGVKILTPDEEGEFLDARARGLAGGTVQQHETIVKVSQGKVVFREPGKAGADPHLQQAERR